MVSLSWPLYIYFSSSSLLPLLISSWTGLATLATMWDSAMALKDGLEMAVEVLGFGGESQTWVNVELGPVWLFCVLTLVGS